jgi:hypothetical protein
MRQNTPAKPQTKLVIAKETVKNLKVGQPAASLPITDRCSEFMCVG